MLELSLRRHDPLASKAAALVAKQQACPSLECPSLKGRFAFTTAFLHTRTCARALLAEIGWALALNGYA